MIDNGESTPRHPVCVGVLPLSSECGVCKTDRQTRPDSSWLRMRCVPPCACFLSSLGQRTWCMSDSYGRILASTARTTSLQCFKLFPLRSDGGGTSLPGSGAFPTFQPFRILRGTCLNGSTTCPPLPAFQSRRAGVRASTSSFRDP
jgi:hypothetical protein